MEHVQKRLGLKFHILEAEGGGRPLCGMSNPIGWQVTIGTLEHCECKNCLRVRKARDGKKEGKEEDARQ